MTKMTLIGTVLDHLVMSICYSETSSYQQYTVTLQLPFMIQMQTTRYHLMDPDRGVCKEKIEYRI